MMLNSQTQIDASLQELIEDKPSSVLKLIEVWDGLSTETQIKIIFTLKGAIPNQIKDKALSHNNSYIRYIVAKNSYFDEEKPEDKKRLEKIANDKSPLVKFSQYLGYLYRFSDSSPESFFSLCKDEKIAILSRSEIQLEYFAEILEWSVEHKPIEQDELDDLVEEFVKNPPTLLYDRELERFWSLVSKISGTKSAMLIIEYFPFMESDNENFLINVLPCLDKYEIRNFLRRKDILLHDFRKKVFLSEDQQYSTNMREAAASRNLELTAQDFHEIIINKDTTLIELLIKINQYAYDQDLRPVYLLVLDKYQRKLPGYDYQKIYDKKYIVEHIKKYPKWERKKIILEVAIYRIANYLVPFDQENEPGAIEYLDNDFHFLKLKVIQNDTWATYMEFSKIRWSSLIERKLLKEFGSEFVRDNETYLENSWELFELEKGGGKLFERKIDCLYERVIKIEEAVEIANSQLKNSPSVRLEKSIKDAFKTIVSLIVVIVVLGVILWGLATPFFIWFVYKAVGKPENWVDVLIYLVAGAPWVGLIIFGIYTEVKNDILEKWKKIVDVWKKITKK